MSLSREKHFEGKVVNNLLIRGNNILAFIYEEKKFRLIDRKAKITTDVPWLSDQPIYCTGLQWAPDFHPRENSIAFIRDPNGIYIINT